MHPVRLLPLSGEGQVIRLRSNFNLASLMLLSLRNNNTKNTIPYASLNRILIHIRGEVERAIELSNRALRNLEFILVG
jgi:hypothetical protein